MTLTRKLTFLTGTVMMMIIATAAAQSDAQTATSPQSGSEPCFLLKAAGGPFSSPVKGATFPASSSLR